MGGVFFFFQAEDGIRDRLVTGVQTCALPIWLPVKCVEETDLMERTADQSYDINENSIELSFRPFEIKTLKVTFDQQSLF